MPAVGVRSSGEQALPTPLREPRGWTCQTGGTVKDGIVFFGTEILTADATTDKEEFRKFPFYNVLGSTGGDVTVLVTHELVHTVQQRGGAGVQTKSVISSPGDAGEREADRVADAIMGGGSPGPIVESTAPIAGNFLTDMFNAVWELFAGKGDKKASEDEGSN